MFDDSTIATYGPGGGVDYAPHNKGITPVFFVEAVLDRAATDKEGRTVYRDKERVKLYIAGDPLSVATHPVDEAIVNRFPDHYRSWKEKNSGSHIRGMPLDKWPLATPGMIKNLEFLNIFSVEDLAAVSDSNIQSILDGRVMRDKAIAWLKSADDGAVATRYAAEASRLREEVEELRRLIAVPKPKGVSQDERERRSARMKERWAKRKEAKFDALNDS